MAGESTFAAEEAQIYAECSRAWRGAAVQTAIRGLGPDTASILSGAVMSQASVFWAEKRERWTPAAYPAKLH